MVGTIIMWPSPITVRIVCLRLCFVMIWHDLLYISMSQRRYVWNFDQILAKPWPSIHQSWRIVRLGFVNPDYLGLRTFWHKSGTANDVCRGKLTHQIWSCFSLLLSLQSALTVTAGEWRSRNAWMRLRWRCWGWYTRDIETRRRHRQWRFLNDWSPMIDADARRLDDQGSSN